MAASNTIADVPPAQHISSRHAQRMSSPDEQPLVPVDHIQQQPLVRIRQLHLVLLLVLQVKPGLLQAQP
jgi:hypothetical protein